MGSGPSQLFPRRVVLHTKTMKLKQISRELLDQEVSNSFSNLALFPSSFIRAIVSHMMNMTMKDRSDLIDQLFESVWKEWEDPDYTRQHETWFSTFGHNVILSMKHPSSIAISIPKKKMVTVIKTTFGEDRYVWNEKNEYLVGSSEDHKVIPIEILFGRKNKDIRIRHKYILFNQPKPTKFDFTTLFGFGPTILDIMTANEISNLEKSLKYIRRFLERVEDSTSSEG